jgi:hypothetical protein
MSNTRENCQYRDGMARLEHDVVTLPPDQVALGLVEAILEQTHYPLGDAASKHLVRLRLGIIRDDATRLKVLLEKQPALLEALGDAHVRFGAIMDTGVPSEAFALAMTGQDDARAAIEAAS